MKCKNCKQGDATLSNPAKIVGVYANTFPQFPQGQYVHLCAECYCNLKGIKPTWENIHKAIWEI